MYDGFSMELVRGIRTLVQDYCREMFCILISLLWSYFVIQSQQSWAKSVRGYAVYFDADRRETSIRTALYAGSGELRRPIVFFSTYPCYVQRAAVPYEMLCQSL